MCCAASIIVLRRFYEKNKFISLIMIFVLCALGLGGCAESGNSAAANADELCELIVYAEISVKPLRFGEKVKTYNFEKKIKVMVTE